ncbi:MAG: outer membrane protein assembly factor, partial [Kiritimatiellia bacterium]
VRVPYSLEQIRVYNVDDSASQTIKDEEGTTLESALGLYFSRDSRNKVFVPTQGSRISAGGKYAGGPLGADSDYYELELNGAKFIPLWFEHVLGIRGALKTVDTHSGATRVAIFNRLFMGGPRTVRAFKYRKVGPRDEDNEPVGGLSTAFASAEYTIPVVKMIRLATFYDAGYCNPDSYDFNQDPGLSTGAGVGFRFDLPQFPLQLDYAWPLESGPENENPSGRFSFFIGHTF